MEGIPEESSADTWNDQELNRSSLYTSGAESWSDLSELARLWLHELNNVGLRTIDPLSGAPQKQLNPRRPAMEPEEGQLYPARVDEHRQVFWLKLDGPRTSRGGKSGYKSIKVFDRPLRTQMAIIGALTVLETGPIDTVRLRQALSQAEPPLEESMNEREMAAWWGELGEEGFKWLTDLQLPYLSYVLSLLQYYRPSFDELPHEQQLDLIAQAGERVNTLLTAARQLVEFLEYGAVDQDLRAAAEDANRDVRAAVLKDVEDMSLIQIAERLGLNITEKYRDQRDHPRVRQMSKRGRKMLESALGKEGWRKQVAAMKAEAKRWQKLSSEEQSIEMWAERDDITVEEARKRYVARKRRGGAMLLSYDDLD
jgi:hypothetical protein